MAKYCRHCGEKMPCPKDQFCLVCRKSGEAVDYFYRYAHASTLASWKQDAIRSLGSDMILCGPILGILPAVGLLGAWLAQEPLPLYLTVILILILLFLLWAAVEGVRLFLLDRKAVDRIWNYIVIKLYLNLMISLSRNSRFRRQLRAMYELLDQFADGTVDPDEEPPKRQIGEKFWICGFCGYKNKNANADYACKSCGKPKDLSR